MFFSTINEVVDGYDLNMTISKKNGVISVMVIPKPTNEKVDLSKVPPFTVSGTAKELDEGFAEAMGKAGRATTGVISSINQFSELLNKEKASQVKSAKVKTPAKKPVKKVAKKPAKTKQDDLFADI